LVAFGWAPDLSALKQLTLVNTDGSGRRVLVSTTANNGTAWPAWSPNGNQIVYQEAGLEGRGQLELIDTLGARRPFLANPGDFTLSVQPAFSANETRLYFFGLQESSGINGIYRANADGTGSQFLFAATQPAPSPDGSKVAYVAGDSLFVRHLGTGDVTAIASSPQLPRWSPAGDLIAFISYDGAAAVRLLRPDGSQLRTLSAGFHDQTVSWSSDGQWLAVARYSGGIELIRIADGETLPIASTRDLFQPAWRP
jgi:TolB protein